MISAFRYASYDPNVLIFQLSYGKIYQNGGISMNVKNQLLSTLANAGDEYISGSALASQLGVSRNAVWKAVKSLEAEGYVIESAASRGYRLGTESNRLAEELILPFLRTEALGRELHVFDELGSTNSTAKELASSGASHGTTVVADMQTAGRGRLGRSFVSPSGKGLYMSVIIRPDIAVETASLITSAAACAAAEAAEKLCGADVHIKWVNDLYLNGKKICGILTEASLGMEMRTLDYAVIGIGVNVRRVGESFGSELSLRATSIEDETGVRLNRNELCAEILNSLEAVLSSLGERSFLGEYRRRELLTGNTITASVGGETIYAKAIGIDDNANLIAELPDGTVRHLSSGEANLCRVSDT